MLELCLLKDGSVMVYRDNKTSIDSSNNPVQHDRMKYVAIDRHFILEKINYGVICLPFVKSSGRLVDILTKGLSSNHFFGIRPKWVYVISTTYLKGSVKYKYRGGG